MSEDLNRMNLLIDQLNQASKSYYMDAEEIMSNYAYDKLYDELLELEKRTGIVLSNSPTIRVGYEVLSNLEKEQHESPMLSLDKTKDRHVLKEWLGPHKGLLSWKLDGLTIVLTYKDGELLKAVTRGNGTTGEVITNNARVFKNLPHQIPFKGEVVLRGEAIIKYSDFQILNDSIEDVQSKYKNPRNLCSGSVRQLNNEITAKRQVYFYAFTLVRSEEDDLNLSREKQLQWLQHMGFQTVDYFTVDQNNLLETIQWFSDHIKDSDLPSDGLVLTYDDLEYSRSLGTTSKFPKDSMAFKWADEVQETVLTEVEWSASRTGLINPVAIFEPVELEGTTVSRASLHNISIMENLQLGLGDHIMVYKANMIIPQISENLTKSGCMVIPEYCPVCKEPTIIVKENDVKVLKCMNPLCDAKKIKRFALFVSRDAFNVDGLSEATLEKFVQNGFIHEFSDIFHLTNHKNEIIAMEGMGEKSYQNLIDAIDRSRKIHAFKLIYSLGIPNVGLSNAKLLCRYFKNQMDPLFHSSAEEMTNIEGIGPVIANAVEDYFKTPLNIQEVLKLLDEVELIEETFEESTSGIAGKTFVITGSVFQFLNRNELKAFIESKGGKVTGSVSSKTDYLINNDMESASSKNKKAKELGIPIINEDIFLKMV